MKFAALAGFLSTLGLIGLSASPLDDDPSFHNAMLAVWLIPTPITIVCFLIGTTFNSKSKKRFIRTCIGLILMTALYPILWPPQNTVVLQKVVVGMAIIWFLTIAYYVFRSAFITMLPSKAAVQRRQEEDYFEDVGRKHHR